MFKRKFILSLLTFFSVTASFAANSRQMEALNRGLVAFRTSENSVFISWRLLGTDAEGTEFNLYRSLDGKPAVKLNEKPLLVTNFSDPVAGKSTVSYFVKPVYKRTEGVPEGNFTLKPGTAKQYISIPLHTPERYTAGDCSTGDLDGDGEYEIVVHMTGAGRDNSQGALPSKQVKSAYSEMESATLYFNPSPSVKYEAMAFSPECPKGGFPKSCARQAAATMSPISVSS